MAFLWLTVPFLFKIRILGFVSFFMLDNKQKENRWRLLNALGCVDAAADALK